MSVEGELKLIGEGRMRGREKEKMDEWKEGRKEKRDKWREEGREGQTEK